ncbi:MAG: hypothetical protein EOO50_14925 [Flavobacterium sp.]|uniref:hypothetical protein n=1 Tax=Flavobacterium sp. TaxID=239 RepID=UPI00120DCA2D|nr:hypothetical protein [Flavobacterium sp.]RZJ65131.1 MAG: hypothetical protein EOO50_14925 [Flavobacterium sp.]
MEKSISKLLTEMTPEKEQRLRENPIPFLEENKSEPSPIHNKWIFLVVVMIVGSVLLTSIILGGIIIFGSETPETAKVPEFLVSIGSTALGALVGLLAPSPGSANQ